jgi:hypothetical protein
MKAIIYVILFFSSIVLNAQNKVIGFYADYFGRKIELKEDSTFEFTQHFDLYGSWTHGSWSIMKDTIHFKMISIYDTAQNIDANGIYKDTLILSLDRKPERIRLPDPSVLNAGGQNYYSSPTKLYYRKNKLYNVTENGKLAKKKIKGFWTKNMYPPWFIKLEKPK